MFNGTDMDQNVFLCFPANGNFYILYGSKCVFMFSCLWEFLYLYLFLFHMRPMY